MSRVAIALYVGLLLSGSFKAAWDQTALSAIDPTVLFATCAIGLALLVRARTPSGRSWSRWEAAYALAFVAFLSYYAASAVGAGSIETMSMLQRVLVFNTGFVVVPLLALRRGWEIDELATWLLAGAAILIGFAASSSTTGLLTLAGTERNYQGVGRVAALAALLALDRALRVSRRDARGLWLGAALLFTAAAVASGTRQAVVGIAVAMIVFGPPVLRTPGRGRATRVAIAVSVAFTFVSALAVGVGSSLETSAGADRIRQSLQALASEGVEGEERIELWQDGLAQWRDAPVFGEGPAAFLQGGGRGVFAHPHNIFIELLVDTGVFGLLLGVSVLAVPILQIVRRASLPAIGPFDAPFVFMLTAAQFSGELASNRWIFAFGALVVTWSWTPDSSATQHSRGR